MALEMFDRSGFDETTVEQICERAGVSVRTFFRYFGSKTTVLWTEVEREIETLRTALTKQPASRSIADAVRVAILESNHANAANGVNMRTRFRIVHAASQARTRWHFEELWVNAVSEFAGSRLGSPADSFLPRAVGLSAVAVCRAAAEQWERSPELSLLDLLDEALSIWSEGFSRVLADRSGGTEVD
ncbi:MAG: TetR family transcriptional regulator [Nocardioides sp.]|uniref:acyl-CoA-like ligand-binding transcription factor n=1 Tax=Nocardioides sp. TaxID=35761 RepID=UPI0039E44AA0